MLRSLVESIEKEVKKVLTNKLTKCLIMTFPITIFLSCSKNKKQNTEKLPRSIVKGRYDRDSSLVEHHVGFGLEIKKIWLGKNGSEVFRNGTSIC